MTVRTSRGDYSVVVAAADDAAPERQRERIARAKREGRYKGRVCADRAPTGCRDHPAQAGGRQALEIAVRLGIGRASVYRVLGSQAAGDRVAA